MLVLLGAKLIASSYAAYGLADFIVAGLVGLYSSVYHIIIYSLHVYSFVTQRYQDSKQFLLSFVEALQFLDALCKLIVQFLNFFVAAAAILYWYSIFNSKSEELSVAVGDATSAHKGLSFIISPTADF